MHKLNLIKMKKILLLLVLICINSIYAQVQFKSLEFETGIRKHLSITETSLISLNSLDTIKKIDLSGLNIKDINDVIFLKKIKELNLSNNQIRDISPLLSLPRLQILNIAGNSIKNISSFTFSDKRNFKLVISDNEITELEYLNPSTFSNVVTIGDNRQKGIEDTYLLKDFYTSTQVNGQAIVKYNIWDSTNNCAPFILNFGDGITVNNLLCDSYTNSQNYNYSSSGFKTLQINRDTKTLTTHFVAPYLYTFEINQNYPLSLNLPSDINLISLENIISMGTATILSNQINYQPIAVGSDIIKINYKYGTSNRTEVFYIFTTNNNTLSINETTIDNNIKTYPNPAKDILNIEASNLELQKIELYDLQGKLILSENIRTYKYQLNLSQLQSATYSIKLYTDKGIKSIKTIKK